MRPRNRETAASAVTYATTMQKMACGACRSVTTALFCVLLVPVAAWAAGDSSSELLREARLNREVLSGDFPGFRSRLRVHVDGAVHEGTMLFKPPITLELGLGDAELAKEVKRTVRSLLSHRMPSQRGDQEKTRLGAADSHPLGRRVLLGDKYDSSYRIRNDRILEVDRQMPGERLVITVLDTMETESGRYLPTSFLVALFDADTGGLISASAYTDAYQQAGPDYVPKSRRIVNAENGRTRMLQVEWIDLQLLPPAEAQ